MLAGESPLGEVVAIRELMPKAHIVAVDKDGSCLEAAITAGVDEVVQCDLSEVSESTKAVRTPTKALAALPPFDIVNLDLCANVSETTKTIFRVNRQLVAKRGVLITAFSYGRDVVEVFLDHKAKANAYQWASFCSRFKGNVLGESLEMRIYWLFRSEELRRIRSVIAYAGNAMPMCSVLSVLGSDAEGTDVSVLCIEPGDFELAVACPDPAKLYDTPQQRIESLRRTFRALKAVHTRRIRAKVGEMREAIASQKPWPDGLWQQTAGNALAVGVAGLEAHDKKHG